MNLGCCLLFITVQNKKQHILPLANYLVTDYMTLHYCLTMVPCRQNGRCLVFTLPPKIITLPSTVDSN